MNKDIDKLREKIVTEMGRYLNGLNEPSNGWREYAEELEVRLVKSLSTKENKQNDL